MQDDIQDLAKKLQESLGRALEANETLKSERDELLEKAQEAEVRATEAELKVQEIEGKLEALDELRRESYQKVVAELFEIPSRRSSRQTTRVAIISIIVTVVITLGATQYSIHSGNRQVSNLLNSLDEELDGIKGIDEKVQNLGSIERSQEEVILATREALSKLNFFWTEENRGDVDKVASYLMGESEKFGGYSSLRWAALAFKSRFLWKFPEKSDDVFLESLREVGAPRYVIAKARKETKNWTVDCVQLHRSWLKELKSAQDRGEEISAELRLLQNFSRPEDTTEYADWGYKDESMKIGAVVSAVSSMLDNCTKHAKLSRLRIE